MHLNLIIRRVELALIISQLNGEIKENSRLNMWFLTKIVFFSPVVNFTKTGKKKYAKQVSLQE